MHNYAADGLLGHHTRLAKSNRTQYKNVYSCTCFPPCPSAMLRGDNSLATGVPTVPECFSMCCSKHKRHRLRRLLLRHRQLA